ncbi:uncharacterized protein B0I36DRAFT_367104 [Microdochium trichocladiopsis]|uniref:Uncharacterized protein n=1 Tax=Microdochium trichocladiopsis TaxID=1682393 RepID=A0A9P8Y1S1_9PEZI|nr:uncharacterized protein B0I36DRAFT_367104 [Microdochium trichocladiopsis]KAH7025237.1 hypothetical protein B0I36DRAFT_367104 [Microdochium trichocladiopsis]
MDAFNNTGAKLWDDDISTDVSSLLTDEHSINVTTSTPDDYCKRFHDTNDDHNSETTSTSGTIFSLDNNWVRARRAQRPSSSNPHATMQSAFDSFTSSLDFEQNTVSPQISDGGLHVRFTSTFGGW